MKKWFFYFLIMKQFSKEAELLLRYVYQTQESIFLTGKAGTGKTTLLKEILETTHKNTVVVAPTGIAALNAKGVTIHSFFGFPFASFIPVETYVDLPENIYIENRKSLKRHFKLNKDKKYIFQKLELLIIDEVSMLRADVLDAIDYMLQYVRNSNKVFGGVQVLFIGDLMQLPPIVKQEEWEVLKQFYDGIYFFNAHCIQKQLPVYIELEKVYRQSDTQFINLLNNVRNQSITQQDLQLLQSKVNVDFDVKKAENTIILTTHNAKADKINSDALKEIKNRSHFFIADIVDDFPERIFPIEEKLELKVGAQVMFTKNDISPEKRYYNGKMGIIHDISDGEIFVHFIEENKIISVDRYEWENIKYKLNPETKELEEEILGTFTQYPLRLAWAITIHKSQGLTFERAALDLNQVFVSGQMYVALSRLRSIEGLILISPINEKLLFDNFEVESFSKNKKNIEKLIQNLSIAERSYLFFQLYDTFLWNELDKSWNLLLKSFVDVSEKSKRKPYQKWAIEMYKQMEPQLQITEKFRRELYNGFYDSSKDFSWLYDRLQKAYAYFYPLVDKWYFDILFHCEKSAKVDKIKVLTEDLTLVEEQMLLVLYKLKKIKKWLDLLADGQEINKDNLKIVEDGALRINYLVEIREIIKESYLSFEEDDELSEGKKVKKTKKSTHSITLELYNKLGNIEEVASVRKLTIGTIYSHLAKLVSEGNLAIEEIMAKEKIHILEDKFTEHTMSLAEVKSLVDDEISWDELRLYKNYLQYISSK